MRTAKENGMNYIETSAKNGKNVEAVIYFPAFSKTKIIGIPRYGKFDI